MSSKLCYIATPYRSSDELGIEQNLLNGRKAAVQLMIATDYYPVSPVLNTGGFHHYEGMVQRYDAFWIAGALELLNRCDAIYLAPGWENSSGCIDEIIFVIRSMIMDQARPITILINSNEGTNPIVEISIADVMDILKKI